MNNKPGSSDLCSGLRNKKCAMPLSSLARELADVVNTFPIEVINSALDDPLPKEIDKEIIRHQNLLSLILFNLASSDNFDFDDFNLNATIAEKEA